MCFAEYLIYASILYISQKAIIKVIIKRVIHNIIESVLRDKISVEGILLLP